MPIARLTTRNEAGHRRKVERVSRHHYRHEAEECDVMGDVASASGPPVYQFVDRINWFAVGEFVYICIQLRLLSEVLASLKFIASD